jgi:SRSO17 transposase
MKLGLDHFEGLSWQGLHRHALMTMIAYAFLQHCRVATASGKIKNQRAAAASTGFSSRAPRYPRTLSDRMLPPRICSLESIRDSCVNRFCPRLG